jgi:hypothetical protein
MYVVNSRKQNMGCSSSINVVETPIIINSCENLAGKFNRVEIPKDVWLSRMTRFIHKHINQFKHYDYNDIEIVYLKLRSYEISASNTSNAKNKHSQAIHVVSDLFRTIPELTPLQLREQLTQMASEYSKDDKEHEFEEIMFVFSIIVNSPNLQFYETKY